MECKNFLNMTPEKLNSIGGPNDDVPFGTMFTGMLIANNFLLGNRSVCDSERTWC